MDSFLMEFHLLQMRESISADISDTFHMHVSHAFHLFYVCAARDKNLHGNF